MERFDSLMDENRYIAAEEACGARKQVIKQGLSEYFLFTIEGREDIEDKQPKRLVALKVADVPLECFYKLSDRDGGQAFTKFYRFKNIKLLRRQGQGEEALGHGEPRACRPCPTARCGCSPSTRTKDLAYVGGTTTKYVPIGDRVEVNVGRDQDITIQRRLKDQKIANVVARQYKRRLDNTFVQYYDLVDYDETFYFEEEIVSGKPVAAKTELERRFDANVVLWGEGDPPQGLDERRARRLRRSASHHRQDREGRSEPRQVFPRPQARREAVGAVFGNL